MRSNTLIMVLMGITLVLVNIVLTALALLLFLNAGY